MNLYEAAVAFAARITEKALEVEDGVVLTATADPAKAAASDGRLVVLVPPPSVDFTNKQTTWQLVVTRGPAPWDVDTLDALARGVELLEPVYPIETATPGTYPLILTQPPVPAYVLRIVTT